MHTHRQQQMQQQHLMESLAALSERRASRHMGASQVSASPSSQTVSTGGLPQTQSQPLGQSPSLSRNPSSSHSHSYSSSTIVAPTTPSSHSFRFTVHPSFGANLPNSIANYMHSFGASDTSSPTPTPALTRFPHHVQHRLSPKSPKSPKSPSSSPRQRQHHVAESSPATSSPRITGPSLLGLPSPTPSCHSSHFGSNRSVSPSSSASPKSVDLCSPLSLSPPGMDSNERSPAKAGDGVERDLERHAMEFRRAKVESAKFIGLKASEALPTVDFGIPKEEASCARESDGLLAGVAPVDMSET